MKGVNWVEGMRIRERLLREGIMMDNHYDNHKSLYIFQKDGAYVSRFNHVVYVGTKGRHHDVHDRSSL